MQVASHNKSKRIILNNRWLPWLRGDVITKCENLKKKCKNLYNFEDQSRLNEKLFFNSVLIFW